MCVQLPNRRAGSWRSTFAYAPHWERVDDVQLAKAVDDFRLTRQTGVPGRRANRLYVQALRPEGDLVAGEGERAPTHRSQLGPSRDAAV
ncbi:MAG: hypothetical protein QOG95_5390 [Mycobacterium sp.]|nr:hypothetical protein [Mycobacterium sp.]